MRPAGVEPTTFGFGGHGNTYVVKADTFLIPVKTDSFGPILRPRASVRVGISGYQTAAMNKGRERMASVRVGINGYQTPRGAGLFCALPSFQSATPPQTADRGKRTVKGEAGREWPVHAFNSRSSGVCLTGDERMRDAQGKA